MGIKETVEEYYKRVDSGDVEWVIEIFAEDACYQRAEAEYAGKKAISRFYREGRKITGNHTIEEPLVIKDVVVVRGIFKGKGAHGEPKEVRFCDFWEFKDSLVRLRQTYLAIGSDYVKE
jgi:ketosteroid isomerase-like protein